MILLDFAEKVKQPKTHKVFALCRIGTAATELAVKVFCVNEFLVIINKLQRDRNCKLYDYTVITTTKLSFSFTL